MQRSSRNIFLILTILAQPGNGALDRLPFQPKLVCIIWWRFYQDLKSWSAENTIWSVSWWTIVNCYAECRPQQRQQLLHLPPLPEGNICIKSAWLTIDFLGIPGFHQDKHNSGLLFVRIFIPSKGQLTIRVLAEESVQQTRCNRKFLSF